jgi:hypothetical protein
LFIYKAATTEQATRKKREKKENLARKELKGERERDGSCWFDGERRIGNKGLLCTSDC